MEITPYDSVVVGGGPAGAAVGRYIAAGGFRVAILEMDEIVGQPVQCSGLVTERTLAAAGLDPAMALNGLTGSAVFSPSGVRYEIGGDRVHAYILDRSQFDAGVMAGALDAGAELWTRTRVVGLSRTNDAVVVRAERDGEPVTFRTRLVVGADGPRSLVAEFLGLPPVSEALRARGADVFLPSRPSTEQVQIFLGDRYAPGFFAWIIPIADDHYRIGWGIGRGVADNQHLDRLCADYSDVFAGMRIISRTGGIIPLGPRPCTSAERGMVVGDAAGQAKSTSGGGLYTSLVCARHCAQTAIAALDTDDLSAARLAEYDVVWRRDIGQELARATALRSSFRVLSDSDIEWALRMLRVPGVRRLVDRYGDIDYPSRLASIALRAAPTLMRLMRAHPKSVEALLHRDHIAGMDEDSESHPSCPGPYLPRETTPGAEAGSIVPSVPGAAVS